MMRKIISTGLKLLPILAIFLILGEFVITNELADLGQRVQRIDHEIDKVSEANIVLRQQVASASSLLTIAEKANAAGLTQLPKYIVIGREEFALHQPR